MGSAAPQPKEDQMEKTIEQLTGFLVRCNIDPNGYGNRIGESVEEMTFRLCNAPPFTDAEIEEWERSIKW